MCAHRAALRDFKWEVVERESSRNGESNGLADRIIVTLIGGGVVGRRRIGGSAKKGKAISDVRGLGIMREGPRSELDGAQS